MEPRGTIQRDRVADDTTALDDLECRVDPEVAPESIPSDEKPEYNLLSTDANFSLVHEIDRPARNVDRLVSMYKAAREGSNNSLTPRRATYSFDDHEEEERRAIAALRELADLVEAQDIVQATLVEDTPIETVEAIRMDDEENKLEDQSRRMKRNIILVWGQLLLVVATVAIIVAVVTSNKGKGSDDKAVPEDFVYVPAKVYDSALIQVRKDIVLKCGVPDKLGFCSYNNVAGMKEGISVDFCKAVAAGLMGVDYHIDLVEVTSATRCTALAGREIDILIWGDTHTMNRDFHEVRRGILTLILCLGASDTRRSHIKLTTCFLITTRREQLT